MPVARSYQTLEIVKDVFEVNNRTYVDVKLKNGSVKTVRWYSDYEFAKMYGEKEVESTGYRPVDGKDHSKDTFFKSQKDILGFKNGYITIFRGNTFNIKEQLKEIGCTFTRLWGWSLSSELELPADLPAGIEPVRLDWDKVGKGDTLLNEDIIKEVVESLSYEPDDSEYVGNIGDRIEVTVTVEKAVDLDGYYGRSRLHSMRDADGNCYVWTTASKSWDEGEVHTIRGTVSEFKTFRGCKQTVLKRCKDLNKEV